MAARCDTQWFTPCSAERARRGAQMADGTTPLTIAGWGSASAVEQSQVVDLASNSNLDKFAESVGASRTTVVRAIIIVPLYTENPYRSGYSSSSPLFRRQVVILAVAGGIFVLMFTYICWYWCCKVPARARPHPS
jgi:hypothetical protein